MNAALVPLTDVAQYPKLYVAARAALCRCDQVDECQEWSNKAAAMAAYARQAKDQTLLDMAARIQARAVRRCGELLQQIPARHGVKTDANRSVTRTAAARSAGLDEHQQAKAIQLAQIPAEEFEERVEAAAPPTIATLAKIGMKARPVGRPKGGAVGQLRRELEKAEELVRIQTINLEDAIANARRIRARLNAYLARDAA